MHVEGVTRKQIVFASMPPTVDAVSGRAGREVQRLEVGAVLQAFVPKLHIRTFCLPPHTTPVSTMMMELTAESGVQILVEAVANGVVMMRDPLTVDAIQPLDFIEFLGRGTTLVAKQQIALFAHE